MSGNPAAQMISLLASLSTSVRAKPDAEPPELWGGATAAVSSPLLCYWSRGVAFAAA